MKKHVYNMAISGIDFLWYLPYYIRIYMIYKAHTFCVAKFQGIPVTTILWPSVSPESQRYKHSAEAEKLWWKKSSWNSCNLA